MKTQLFTSFIGLLFALSSAHAQDTVKIAVSLEDYPPFFFEEGGVRVGFDIDLSKEICQRINLKYTTQYDTFSKLIPSVRFKKNDMVISAVTDNEFRRRVVDFSKTYSSEEAKLAINSKNSTLKDFCRNCPKTLDLSKKQHEKMFNNELLKFFTGKKVGVLTGTVSALYLERNKVLKDNITIVYLDKTNDHLKSLNNLSLDATFALNSDLLKRHKNTYPDLQLLDNNLTGSYFGYGLSVAISKEKPELLTQVNTAIENMESDGTLEKLTQKWFN